MKKESVKQEGLTDEMKGLSDLIGFEAVMQLIKFYSGERIYIPNYQSINRHVRNRECLKQEELTDDMKKVSDLIGFEAVMLLIKTYSGERIYLPKYQSVYRLARNREIIKNFDGRNIRQLSRKFQLTHTHIRNILKMK